MLFVFIANHRAAIAARTRVKAELANGVAAFLDCLVTSAEAPERLRVVASLHGRELFDAGFTIGQVVEEYGDLGRAIAELVVELDAPITSEQMQRLSGYLELAVADAVSAYAHQSDQVVVDRSTNQLGFLAHELRNLLYTATLAYDSVHSGDVGVDGTTAGLLGKSLDRMRELVTRALAEARRESAPVRDDHVPLVRLLQEVSAVGAAHAKTRDVQLDLGPMPDDLAVEGDEEAVLAIITNLVQNACKFTRPHGRVAIGTRITPDRIFIHVADECGGLPPGNHDELFDHYEQRHSDRSGAGLGLAISLERAHAIGGDIKITNHPGVGCVFTVDLRRSHALAPAIEA